MYKWYLSTPFLVLCLSLNLVGAPANACCCLANSKSHHFLAFASVITDAVACGGCVVLFTVYTCTRSQCYCFFWPAGTLQLLVRRPCWAAEFLCPPVLTRSALCCVDLHPRVAACPSVRTSRINKTTGARLDGATPAVCVLAWGLGGGGCGGKCCLGRPRQAAAFADAQVVPLSASVSNSSSGGEIVAVLLRVWRPCA